MQVSVPRKPIPSRSISATSTSISQKESSPAPQSVTARRRPIPARSTSTTSSSVSQTEPSQTPRSVTPCRQTQPSLARSTSAASTSVCSAQAPSRIAQSVSSRHQAQSASTTSASVSQRGPSHNPQSVSSRPSQPILTDLWHATLLKLQDLHNQANALQGRLQTTREQHARKELELWILFYNTEGIASLASSSSSSSSLSTPTTSTHSNSSAIPGSANGLWNLLRTRAHAIEPQIQVIAKTRRHQETLVQVQIAAVKRRTIELECNLAGKIIDEGEKWLQRDAVGKVFDILGEEKTVEQSPKVDEEADEEEEKDTQSSVGASSSASNPNSRKRKRAAALSIVFRYTNFLQYGPVPGSPLPTAIPTPAHLRTDFAHFLLLAERENLPGFLHLRKHYDLLYLWSWDRSIEDAAERFNSRLFLERELGHCSKAASRAVSNSGSHTVSSSTSGTVSRAPSSAQTPCPAPRLTEELIAHAPELQDEIITRDWAVHIGSKESQDGEPRPESPTIPIDVPKPPISPSEYQEIVKREHERIDSAQCSQEDKEEEVQGTEPKHPQGAEEMQELEPHQAQETNQPQAAEEAQGSQSHQARETEQPQAGVETQGSESRQAQDIEHPQAAEEEPQESDSHQAQETEQPPSHSQDPSSSSTGSTPSPGSQEKLSLSMVCKTPQPLISTHPSAENHVPLALTPATTPPRANKASLTTTSPFSTGASPQPDGTPGKEEKRRMLDLVQDPKKVLGVIQDSRKVVGGKYLESRKAVGGAVKDSRKVLGRVFSRGRKE